MVEMFDDVTHVEFGKVNPNGTLLSGGQIQIKDLDGNVLVDFVPDGTVYRVDGVLKAGETYVIQKYQLLVDTGYLRIRSLLCHWVRKQKKSDL